ncbi:MAG: lipoyl(octanoyl) transferase [Verrucomicrobia bacterium GWC2_42_7]|nr:MAG: lipoyl(octanoyl) transferase [Verrucomicrobia bacterium GWC2_42_7]
MNDFELLAISFEDWGLTRYRDAFNRQQEKVLMRRDEKVGDTLIFTEHYPVYTIGVSRDAHRNILWNEEQLKQRGIEVVETNRGGDVTYHGPGQLVGYIVVKLDKSQHLHSFLRFWEQILIDALAQLGIQAGRREGKTGVWIGTKKIAAMGIAVKHGITYHGFAINVFNDLSSFNGIVPCGIPLTEGSVTSITEELGKSIEIDTVKSLIMKVCSIVKTV